MKFTTLLTIFASTSVVFATDTVPVNMDNPGNQNPSSMENPVNQNLSSMDNSFDSSFGFLFSGNNESTIPVDLSGFINQNPASMGFGEGFTECFEYLSNYEECFNEAINTEEQCAKIESDDCQKFFSTSIVDAPECQKVSKGPLLVFNELLKMQSNYSKFNCSKDEQGQYCPLNSIGLQKNYNFDGSENKKEEIYDKAIEDTCKSQKCTDSYLTFISGAKDDHKQLIDTLTNEKLGQNEVKE